MIHEYTFKRESEAGVKYRVCRSRDTDKYPATASTIERDGTTFIKSINHDHNHTSKVFEKRVEIVENKAVKNAVRNPTIPCRTVLAELANNLQTDSMAAASSMSRMSGRFEEILTQLQQGNLQGVYVWPQG